MAVGNRIFLRTPMLRPLVALAAALLLSFALGNPVEAQEWRPSSRAMPSMPRSDDLPGNLPSSGWFSGVESIAGVSPSRLRAVAEGRGPGGVAQVVRFNNGPLPVVVWQDRNADGKADIVEIFRGGTVVLQVIDADYDGQANVLRRYDNGGRLISEERL